MLLRESDESRYIGIAMPRFLARRPYGAKSDPVDAFDFEEQTGGPGEQAATMDGGHGASKGNHWGWAQPAGRLAVAARAAPTTATVRRPCR